MPQLDHAQRWIPMAHAMDDLQLLLHMLVWMTVRPSGLAGDGRHTFIRALFPEVDVRPIGFCYIFGILHQRLPICRYDMSCVIPLLMRDIVFFRKVGVVT